MVCVFAFLMMVMIIGLATHKSGEVLQLGRTIEQERLVLFAEAGLNEMLAAVKVAANDRRTTLGRAFFEFWKTPPGLPTVVFRADLPASQLPVANALAAEQLGGRAEISGQVKVVILDRIPGPRPSYTGYVELISQARSRELPEIKVKERREVKIADLSYPFLDKYALFVKSFCRTLNNPNRRLIIQGIPPSDPNLYSFVYLGNRSYPPCPEFPQGAKSTETPPVLLDIAFKDDHRLLGSFYRPAPFQMTNPEFVQASRDNLFYVIPPVPFNTIANSFAKPADFVRTPELISFYQSIIRVSQPYADDEGSLGYLVLKDYQRAGGDPGRSEVFKSLVTTLVSKWQYQYGYSDFDSVAGDSGRTFVSKPPFCGILDYFLYYSQANPQKVIGGKMPLLFGPNRDTPVFVEGPVRLRFFKIAFCDEVKLTFDLYGSNSMQLPFPTLPLRFEEQPRTFAGKPCTPQVDERTKVLMSEAIDVLSINHLFFGVGRTMTPKPTTGRGPIEGHDVFPAFDESLRSVAHVYPTAEEFVRDRLKTIQGERMLDLDGVALILSCGRSPLDLTSVSRYRGKGRIVIREGNCILGSLAPLDQRLDSLGISLMFGNFLVRGAGDDVIIHASLAATTCFSDNSSPDPSAESGLHCGGKNVTIHGNLVVDNLFELKSLPEGGRLTIVHDPNLYLPEYPVRVSIGEAKSLVAVDYAQ